MIRRSLFSALAVSDRALAVSDRALAVSDWALAGLGLALAVGLVACAGTHIGDPNDYDAVALNRVFPYPSPEELARQKTEVVLATHYTTELPSSVVGQSMTAVQQRLLRVLDEAGARVIDRSLDDLRKVRRDLTRQYEERGGSSQADWALISRMARYEHHSSYEAASSLFKSDEELASEPGTCTHTGLVEVDIKALVIPRDRSARATFTLKNSGDFTQEDYEESCPITDARKEALLEEILEESLPCIDVQIKNQFAPRGYIEEHRISATGDAHIFKTSLGRKNGARAGIELSIFRVQYMTTVDGRQGREERRIGQATITDEIGDEFSWVSVDLGDVEQTILAGDTVRAVYSDTLAAGLGFGSCSKMLTVHSGPR